MVAPGKVAGIGGVVVVLAAAVAAVSGIVAAAPVSAGCQVQPFVTWCDGPIQPDGSWQRCWQNPPAWVGNSSGGFVINGGSQCNTVYPGQPLDGWGQPPHYIP